MSFHGHFWTIAPVVKSAVAPTKLLASTAWSTTVPDDQRDVTLTGRLSPNQEGDTLVILIHGLGGSPDANYVKSAARAVEALGLPYLRMAVRGADRGGADIYHGGLTADLRAAVASPEVARYDRVALLGFSMGGHVSLCYAAGETDPRVRAVGAVCPPLDLGATADAIDAGAFNVYRRHVLVGLKEIYAKAHAKAPLPTPLKRIKQVKRLREWDSVTVVPRFGFRDVEHYYGTMSAGPGLARIDVPTLVVAMKADPMIPIETLRPYFAEASPAVTAVESDRGGHVGWPGGVDLGLGSSSGVDAQVVRWLADRLAE